MSDYQIAPTFAPPFIRRPGSRDASETTINPIWLGWFLAASRKLDNPVLQNGDYGDITVSGGGVTFTIDAGAVTYAKIQNVSATDRILGRVSAGAGPIEEITCTAAGRALLDDADAAAQRTTLGATAAGSAIFTAASAAAQRTALGLGTTDSPTFVGLTLDDLSVGNIGNFFIILATTISTTDLEVGANALFSGNADFTDGTTVRGRLKWGLGVFGRNTLFIESLTANADVVLRAPAGSGQVRFSDDAGLELLSVDFVNNRINCYRPVVMPSYTVATLPAAPAGARAYVTDALGPAFGAAPVGGGAVGVPVYRDSVGWKVG